MMAPEHVHVLLNPLPLYGMATALFVLAVALAAKSRPAQMIALLTLALLGPATWATVEFGEEGYDRVLSLSNQDARAWLDVHKKRAQAGQYVFYLMALIAVAALFSSWRHHPFAHVLIGATLVLTLASVILAGWISYAGGQVRHSEFREGPPPK